MKKKNYIGTIIKTKVASIHCNFLPLVSRKMVTPKPRVSGPSPVLIDLMCQPAAALHATVKWLEHTENSPDSHHRYLL